MKSALMLLMAVVLCAGCATSTVQTRKQERASAYGALDPGDRALVDQGKIKVGMTKDAVYIAWGKPSEVLTGESSQGATTTWLYHGSTLQGHRYWAYRPSFYGHCYAYGAPYLEIDYYPVHFVQAEVIFQDGKVKEWRTLPHPEYY